MVFLYFPVIRYSDDRIGVKHLVHWLRSKRIPRRDSGLIPVTTDDNGSADDADDDEQRPLLFTNVPPRMVVIEDLMGGLRDDATETRNHDYHYHFRGSFSARACHSGNEN